jgi:2-polyprenyl-3-methyl-5-hydroxy-6-metoxy-1,4-benzoquinol methylase
MKIANPEKRLGQFWGEVDKKHIQAIADHVSGTKVLDMGCGLGTTTKNMTDMGLTSIGIDYDKDTVEYCKSAYPSCNFQMANAEQLPFEDGYFDTIVLRDALHHFYGEADFIKVKKEILRVAKPNARIIFFDPNVNFLLKTMRKLSAHDDEECKYETALEIMNEMGCKVIHKSFNTLYSLPLSGGYVGVNFVPNSKFIYKLVLGSEKIAEKVVAGIGLGRHLCWRYVIVGQR